MAKNQETAYGIIFFLVTSLRGLRSEKKGFWKNAKNKNSRIKLSLFRYWLGIGIKIKRRVFLPLQATIFIKRRRSFWASFMFWGQLTITRVSVRMLAVGQVIYLKFS